MANVSMIFRSAMMDWPAAAAEARHLMDNSTWSPTLFTYLFVCFASLIDDQDARPSDKELQALLVKATKLKKNFGGRIAFHEQLVITKSRKAAKEFKAGDVHCGGLLPALDMMYLFNAFHIAACDGTALPKLVTLIESKMSAKSVEGHKLHGGQDIASHCYLNFMRAVCHNRQKAAILAEKCFLEVIAW